MRTVHLAVTDGAARDGRSGWIVCPADTIDGDALVEPRNATAVEYRVFAFGTRDYIRNPRFDRGVFRRRCLADLQADERSHAALPHVAAGHGGRS
ncbi:hypothetical protein CNR27_04730 [Luteimonas chenhongjianii]|uniref:Uncharacterized protein n=1 Tax=Luteimonas chenhongjianii TaxID=2006110 RepID=A0A290XCL9_9GAMM|nr:hypothetical protein [Luteimonas chenhongjianii]ATD66839.1 hypothetical protein CNR27_04730 [Luteimonas chenhongjianii]